MLGSTCRSKIKFKLLNFFEAIVSSCWVGLFLYSSLILAGGGGRGVETDRARCYFSGKRKFTRLDFYFYFFINNLGKMMVKHRYPVGSVEEGSSVRSFFVCGHFNYFCCKTGERKKKLSDSL